LLGISADQLAHQVQYVDAQRILAEAASTLAAKPELDDTLYQDLRERISTGDAILDGLLGGGMMTGAIWEIVGER
jgi:DNA repair protein RAD57